MAPSGINTIVKHFLHSSGTFYFCWALFLFWTPLPLPKMSPLLLRPDIPCASIIMLYTIINGTTPVDSRNYLQRIRSRPWDTHCKSFIAPFTVTPEIIWTLAAGFTRWTWGWCAQFALASTLRPSHMVSCHEPYGRSHLVPPKIGLHAFCPCGSSMLMSIWYQAVLYINHLSPSLLLP